MNILDTCLWATWPSASTRNQSNRDDESWKVFHQTTFILDDLLITCLVYLSWYRKRVEKNSLDLSKSAHHRNVEINLCTPFSSYQSFFSIQFESYPSTRYSSSLLTTPKLLFPPWTNTWIDLNKKMFPLSKKYEILSANNK